MSTLETILEATRGREAGLRARRGELERAASAAPHGRSFAQALRAGPVAVVAEVKRRSPSRGEIQPGLDPVAHAARYAAHGAAAISVLTDGPFFGGSLADLRAVADRVAIPLLRKDFVLFEEQLLEARIAGASAVLLIVRALSDERLRALSREAERVGLDVLVEVHDATELGRALEVGAAIIGVNSRNLDTFAVDTPAAWRLLSTIPSERLAVAESGMATRADVARAADAGADAVLIGGALSALADPAPLLQQLATVPRHGR